MKEFSDNDKLSVRSTGDGDLEADQTHWSKNITAPKSTHYIITFDRKVLADDIDNLDLDVMPGFRFAWKYIGHVKPWAKYRNYKLTQQFVRYIFYKDKVLFDFNVQYSDLLTCWT